MKVEEYCKREVISIGPDADLGEAAKLMRERHVGFLVVIAPIFEVDMPADHNRSHADYRRRLSRLLRFDSAC